MGLCFSHCKISAHSRGPNQKKVPELQNALTKPDHVLINETLRAPSHAMLSRWIHCNACNSANLNPCLLTCGQSPNWAITAKGRNSVTEMEWGETEGSPSAAGGVALQYNQGCSRIGKHFTNKINGDQPTFHLSLSQRPKAELFCQPHFQRKHAFQSHLFF